MASFEEPPEKIRWSAVIREVDIGKSFRVPCKDKEDGKRIAVNIWGTIRPSRETGLRVKIEVTDFVIKVTRLA